MTSGLDEVEGMIDARRIRLLLIFFTGVTTLVPAFSHHGLHLLSVLDRDSQVCTVEEEMLRNATLHHMSCKVPSWRVRMAQPRISLSLHRQPSALYSYKEL